MEARSLVWAHPTLQLKGAEVLLGTWHCSTQPWRRTGGWSQGVYSRQHSRKETTASDFTGLSFERRSSQHSSWWLYERKQEQLRVGLMFWVKRVYSHSPHELDKDKSNQSVMCYEAIAGLWLACHMLIISTSSVCCVQTSQMRYMLFTKLYRCCRGGQSLGSAFQDLH